MTTLIKQRTPTDCNLCCIAMALGKTYEEVDAMLTQKDTPELAKKGMSNQIEDRLLMVFGLINGVDFTRRYPSSHLITTQYQRNMLWGRRAILSVMSKNVKDG